MDALQEIREQAKVSPFPFNTKIGIIVDEICECGALRSQHDHTLLFGHGPCEATGCDKFSWAKFVMEGN